MSVVSVGLHIDDDFETSVRVQGQEAVRESKYRVVYKVQTDDPDTPKLDILNHEDLPDLFDPHPEDFTARLSSKRPSLFSSDSQLVYLVICDYSTLTPPETQEKNPENPLAAPVQISVSTATKQVAIFEDVNGDPIVNTIGDYFDPGLEAPRFIDVVTFVRNEPTYSISSGRGYKGKVNSSTVAGATAGTLMCTDIAAERVVTSDPFYWRVTYVFQYDPDGWQPSVLNASTVVFNGADYIKPVDDNGQVINRAVPIDEDGYHTLDPILVDFTIYDSADFNALGLPFN